MPEPERKPYGWKLAQRPYHDPVAHAEYISRLRTQCINARWERVRKTRAAMSAEGTSVPAPSGPPKVASTFRKRKPKDEIDYGPLKAWMKHFALWLANQAEEPPILVQAKQAGYLSKMKFTAPLVKRLKRRIDFQDCYAAYQNYVVEKAKVEYEALYPKMIQAQSVALDKAIEDQSLKGVGGIIQAGMDRLLPKKTDPGAVQRNITINLNSAAQAANLLRAVDDETVVEDAEFEVVTETKALPA